MPLKGKKIIVTGGPTREWIDPVRFISNASSGKMGLALADAAYKKAKETVFIHGPIDKSLLKDKLFRTIQIETTIDLLNAVLSELEPATILIMAAAPADYKPLKKSSTKIKKANENLNLALTKNPDILENISKKKSEDKSISDLFIVGFAAETNNIEENAIIKLQRKKMDMICLNDVSQKDAGFASNNNLITIFIKNGNKIELPLLSKAEAADRILDQIEKELQK